MSKRINQYKHSDDQGSYTVCFGDKTLEVKFVGFLSEQLIEKFCADLELMLGVIEWQYWGYYGDLSESAEQFSQTTDMLSKLLNRYIEKGCVIDAYTVSTPLAVELITKTRHGAGILKGSIEKHIFADKEQAIQFIHQILEKIENEKGIL